MRLIHYLVIVAIAIGAPSCSRHLKLQAIVPDAISLGKEQPADSSIVSLIQPYKSKLENEMNEVLVISDAEAVKGQPEGSLGSLIADITLAETNKFMQGAQQELAAICMLNNGGLRTSLPKGEIILGKIFELMPFENEIVVLTLSGSKTKQMFNYIAKSNGVPLAGATMQIQNESAEAIIIQGEPMDTTKSYMVVTSDYLAGGGDKMRFFNEPLARINTGIKLRDALITQMRNIHAQQIHLNPKTDGRIKLK